MWNATRKNPNKGGTNLDKSISTTYCSFCYQNGKFKDEGTTLEEKIEKNIKIAVAQLNILEIQTREIATSTLPFLKRWK